MCLFLQAGVVEIFNSFSRNLEMSLTIEELIMDGNEFDKVKRKRGGKLYFAFLISIFSRLVAMPCRSGLTRSKTFLRCRSFLFKEPNLMLILRFTDTRWMLCQRFGSCICLATNFQRKWRRWDRYICLTIDNCNFSFLWIEYRCSCCFQQCDFEWALFVWLRSWRRKQHEG